jgi:DNA primase
MLTESPIDAMSLAMLDRQNRVRAGVTIYLSVDGAGALPVEALKAVMQRGGKVEIAFDADKPGELMAWRMAQQLLGAERLLPSRGKDWNDQLIGIRQTISQDYEPELTTLRKWHQAAFSIKRSEQYLNRIAEVAISYVKGESLSEKARAAMEKDLEIFDRKTPHKSVEQDR